MKPFLLVFFNSIKIVIKKMKCQGLSADGIQMMGWNTKLNIHPKSKVHLGERLISDGRLVIMTDKYACLEIGDHVYLNENVMISCKGKIFIGSGTKFGPNVQVFDNNHRFDPINGVSNEHSSGSVEIGENCWIGANAVLLKGTKIGKNSVIGAGCVISGTIPEASIVTQGRDLCIRQMGM